MPLSDNWLEKAMVDVRKQIDEMPLWLRDLGHLPRNVPKYSMVLQWSEEDGEYIVTSPEWPGLSYLDPSAVRAVDQLQSVIAAALDICRGDKMTPPEPRFYRPAR